jgi:MFS family permease
MNEDTKPWGYEWRSSRRLVVSSITVALFTGMWVVVSFTRALVPHLSHAKNPPETFLYGFLTPILSYMLEERLHLDPSQTQTYTTALLTTHGFIGLISAPMVAHLAEKTPSQKKPLLIALAGCFLGTLLIALAPSGKSTSDLEDNSWELTIINSVAALRWSHPAIHGGYRHLGRWICSFGK